MAELKLGVEVGAALGGGHRGAEEVDSKGLVKLGVLFGAADVFAIGGVIGHQSPAWPGHYTSACIGGVKGRSHLDDLPTLRQVH